MKKYIPFLVVILIGSCAYYNTFFNAKQNYNQGREKQKNSKSEKIPSDVKKHYTNAIEKSWKLIDVYGDSSKYADDALFLIGKSHYQIEEYNKAERIFDQFLLKYLNSEYIPEVKLWLGKTYIKLEKNDEALQMYNDLFKQKISKSIAAEAFYYLGLLNFGRDNYESAIENFQKCISLDPEEEVAGASQFKIGQSFYKLGQYENAIYNFDQVLDYDLPAVEHYDALMEMTNAQIKIGDFAEAEATLRYMLRNQRFKDRFARIETKMGNIYEFQGEIGLAKEYYESIVEEYPKTEGAALAYFYLGQLYEKEFGIMDSASVKYEQVKRTYSQSEAAEEAENRRKILSEYLNLREQIKKDLNDLYKLSIGDSTLIDSVVTGQDTVETLLTPEQLAQDSLMMDSPQGSLERKQKRVVQKKEAVTRDPETVENSLLKNRFSLAEFFLFKYQHYDSAQSAYQKFITHHSDSLLTPKAFYALYYINSKIKQNPERATALKDSIIQKYPESVYARKFTGKPEEEQQLETDQVENRMHDRYREAETLMDQKQYRQAISLFNQIAQQDSGSIWAKKARYATAYIYENWVKDTTEAIHSYGLLAKEYPDTKFGQIAKNKIKEPVVEADTSGQVSDSLRTEDLEAPGSPEEHEPEQEIRRERQIDDLPESSPEAKPEKEQDVSREPRPRLNEKERKR